MNGLNGGALVLFIAFCIAVVWVGFEAEKRLTAWVQKWAGDIPIRERSDDAVQAAWVAHERQVQLDRSFRRQP